MAAVASSGERCRREALAHDNAGRSRFSRKRPDTLS
jgi:hypothetical protein